MVRNYRPKNRYQKWSKLSDEQMAYIVHAFCRFATIEETARELEVSTKTVRAKFNFLNDKVMNNPKILTDLFEYLSPELDRLAWVKDVDLSHGSDFWRGLWSCFFHCPAESSENLMFSELKNSPAFKFVKLIGLTPSGDRVRVLRISCSACPLLKKGEYTRTLLPDLKGRFLFHRWTTPHAMRAHFLSVFLDLGMAARAGIAVLNREEGVSAHRASLVSRTKAARDVAIILASHLSQAHQDPK